MHALCVKRKVLGTLGKLAGNWEFSHLSLNWTYSGSLHLCQETPLVVLYKSSLPRMYHFITISIIFLCNMLKKRK
jgi:hypothetical protein